MQREPSEAGVDEQFLQRLGKMLSDPLRMNIIYECRIRPTSPRGFRERFGGPSHSELAALFRELEQFDWLEAMPRPEPAPEGDETPSDLDLPYRTIQSTIFDEPTWSALPGSVRSMMASRFLESLLGRARSAIGAGTFHARPDSHVSWTPLALDEQGWKTVIERMDALFYGLFEEQERADERMAESGEEAISMTVAMLGFESPETPGMMR